MNDLIKIIYGDCLEEMKKMESNSISCIITDPPYGLKFMGKEWDKITPGYGYWKHALRICKPGSFLLAFGGTRTFHRLTCAIEDAGWEIRDCLMWLYGSGFPKSHNHFGIEGFGTALKPAWEPIIMAMKPCEGTFKQNAEKWEQAGININACRIQGELSEDRLRHADDNYSEQIKPLNPNAINSIPSARWPANLIFDEEAAQILDEQSGILKSGGGIKNPIGGSITVFRTSIWKDSGYIEKDSGGASRFFYCAKASPKERNKGCEDLEKFKGKRTFEGGEMLTGAGNKRNDLMSNFHPTVKPLKLMEYLIKLVMPPKKGILLDPFCGSGTTLLAAKNLGFNAIGIEINPDYVEIAKKRLE